MRRKRISAILDWTEAYPEHVFPEQDLKRANEILAAAGISMSAMFGTWGRHITQGIAFQAMAAQGALLGVQAKVGFFPQVLRSNLFKPQTEDSIQRIKAALVLTSMYVPAEHRGLVASAHEEVKTLLAEISELTRKRCSP